MNQNLKEQVLANRRLEDRYIRNAVVNDHFIEGASVRTLSLSDSPDFSYQSSVLAPHLVVPYVLSGTMNIDYLDIEQSVPIAKNQHRFVYQPEFHIKVKYQADQRFEGVRLLLDENYLQRYQSLIEDYMPGLAESISTNQPFISDQAQTEVSIGEWQVLQDMVHCQFTGPIRDLYIESKIGELLAQRFSVLSANGTTKRKFKSRDYQKIRALKHYLEETYHQKHSLHGLAREFGLNTFKLKTGFKELYGMPVYQFILSLRMSSARSMLKDGMNVNEVSNYLGYSQPNYFSMAFKKHFGFSPGRLKA